MRQAIKTVPMDGKFVILEDDASGTREVARWSTEAGGWVGEDGAPSKITPTYWHPLSQEDHGSELSLPEWSPSEEAQAQIRRMLAAEVYAEDAPVEANHRPRARRRLAVSSMAAILVGVTLLGFLFRVELAAYVTRHAHLYIAKIEMIGKNVIEHIVSHETTSPSPELQSAELSVQNQELLHRLDEFPLEGAQTGAQGTQTAEGALEPRESSDKERRRTGDMANTLAEARRLTDVDNGQLKAAAQATQSRLSNTSTAEGKELIRERVKTASLGRDVAEARRELKANSAQNCRELAEERKRTATLTRELARARDEIEAHAALSSKTGAEAAQVKQAAESVTAELRQSLQQERDRAEALSRELARARDEIEAHAALSSKTGVEAAQVKQAAESVTAELRQSLQQERDRAEALSRELARARDEIEAHAALSSKTGAEAAQVKQAAESVTAELRQSLQQERDRAEALSRELARARDEIEAHAALSSKTGVEAAQVKQAAESVTAELRQSLQQERDRAETLTREIGSARRVHARIAFERDSLAALPARCQYGDR